ncbi:class I SAM-dependent methyltransferase [Spongiactinospora sp. TRM90649]|uniref:class I SAM-dependent methyltransferase n=1 Tax=Spongiactinospora sp. TRM90649 TaxID=3031114 RepID=UPI0023FA1F88|nr:class I SAM-dependent methyltransferase [Spongiactinospora sp. TRM90649]MDF5756427.1 class I SAM-dependent methyltransferase [Spongiactinospora sp. TRM90649]
MTDATMVPEMPPDLRWAAERAKGFMPGREGTALFETACAYGPLGPICEIGSYCGKSAIYLAAAARHAGSVVITVDHHRGSEEIQPGWAHHDPALMDPRFGKMDSLPFFRTAIASAGLEDEVIAVVGRSERVSALWNTPLAMLFIDGGHADAPATADYEGWSPHVMPGGALAIHDVFERPEDGGQAPYRIFRRALESGEFREVRQVGSLRVLERVSRR